MLSVGSGLLSQAALVVSGILVARTLGVTNRGHLALLTVVATGLAFVGLFGVPDALSYYISRNRPAARTLARRLLALVLGQVAALVVVLAAVLALVVEGEATGIKLAAVVMVGWIPGFVAYMYGLAVLQAERRFVAFNSLRFVPAGLYAVLVVAVVLAGRSSVAAYACAWAVAFGAAGTAAACLAVRAIRGATAPAAERVRDVAAFGARGAIGQVSLAETFRVDQLVAGLFVGTAPLGLYAVAAAFTTLPMIVAMSIGMVAYPHVAAELDRAAGRRIVVRYLALTVAVSVALVAALELLLPVILPWLFGSDFAPAVPSARILVFGGIALAARRILSDGVRGLGRPAAGTFAELASWAVLVPLLAVLTPLYGISGVAAAVVSSAFVGVAFLAVSLVRLPVAATGVRS